MFVIIKDNKDNIIYKGEAYNAHIKKGKTIQFYAQGQFRIVKVTRILNWAAVKVVPIYYLRSILSERMMEVLSIERIKRKISGGR